MKTLKITIWDTNGDRIIRIQTRLYNAMKRCRVNGVVDSMSEPPLIGRMNLLNRIPVLEVDGFWWSICPDEEFSEEECRTFIEIMMEKYGL